jgi:hypothetical protein
VAGAGFGQLLLALGELAGEGFEAVLALLAAGLPQGALLADEVGGVLLELGGKAGAALRASASRRTRAAWAPHRPCWASPCSALNCRFWTVASTSPFFTTAPSRALSACRMPPSMLWICCTRLDGITAPWAFRDVEGAKLIQANSSTKNSAVVASRISTALRGRGRSPGGC